MMHFLVPLCDQRSAELMGLLGELWSVCPSVARELLLKFRAVKFMRSTR